MGDKTGIEYGGGLIDVTGLSLSDLETIDGTSLAPFLRRILTDSESAPVAGFQSAL